MNQFSDVIKTIARGQKAGRSLTQDEARFAMDQIFSGKVAPEQLGAFLMLMRLKEETSEELAGFLQATRMHVAKDFTDLQVDLDLGCYAGKRRHLPWFVLAMVILSQQGYRVFCHGGIEPNSQRLHLEQVFNALGLPTATNGRQAKNHLDTFGLCFAPLHILHPELNNLLQMRPLFGLRSMANTLARMLNPTDAKASLHGVFHRHFDYRHVETALLCQDSNVACFRGEGGEIEVNPERLFELHLCENNSLNKVVFPALLQQRQIKPRELDLQLLKNVWLGESQDPYGEQAVIGTLACYLRLINKIPTEEALAQGQKLWHNRNPQPFSDLFNPSPEQVA